MKKKNKQFRTVRRDFMAGIGTATLAGCATSRQSDFFDPIGKIPRPRIIQPDEKMNVACIGVGGKGKSDTMAMKGENVVALCDVNATTLAKMSKTYPKAKLYSDYRKMLREMDQEIDAVTISTPDHTHYPAAMMAISRGKHVFVQKPMTHDIWEARQLTLAARRAGVATQMGNQGHSNTGTRMLVEWIAAGAIGDVTEVHLCTDRPTGWGEPCGMDRPTETLPIPEDLSWDIWLGTAPYRPYHPLYQPKKWRSWWDFGAGAMGDMGCHIMDASFWALDLGYPMSVDAETSPVNDETFPKSSIITFKYPQRGNKPPVKVVWYDGGNKPPRPPQLEKGREVPISPGGQILYGTKGAIMAGCYCENPRIIPEAKMREFLPNRPEPTVPRSPGHVEEWIRACKGGVPAMSNFDVAGPLTEVVLLGNLAIRTGKKIEFDPKTLKVTNLPEANQYIRKSYRAY